MGKSGLTKAWKLAGLVKLTSRERQRLGLEAATIVRERAFPNSGAGRDRKGQPYSAYSAKPIYVSKASPPRPADMPAPKGLTATGAKSAIKKGAHGARGQTSKGRKTVFYPGGYSQYRASAGRSYGKDKNLVMTGQTARSLGVLEHDVRRILLGFSKRRARAVALDDAYDFMGLLPTEEERIAAIWAAIVAERLNGK